ETSVTRMSLFRLILGRHHGPNRRRFRSMRATFRTLSLSLAALALAACTAAIAPEPEARARNVILFVGDGMGISTLTAIRIHAGQLGGSPGEDHVLPWDAFPHVALVKTYNTNQQVPDSAGTATAILTGEKTRS